MPENQRELSVGAAFGRRAPPTIAKPSTLLVSNDTNVGVEFEFEGVAARSIPTLSEFWDHKSDGSLHNAGREFVFSDPLYGENIVHAIEELCRVAVEKRWLVSERTGLHVHVDVRPLSRASLIGFIAYYCMFEPAIYRLHGRNREVSNFCLPFYKAHRSLSQAVNIVHAMYRPSRDTILAQEASAGFDRYTGMNLKSLQQFGSVEFRHMLTTTDTSKILDWINMLFSLKNAAQDLPASTSMVVCERAMREGPHRLAVSVFGPALAEKLCSYPEFVSEFYAYGFPNAWKVLKAGDTYLAPPVAHEAARGDPWEEPVVEKSHKAALAWENSNFPKE